MRHQDLWVDAILGTGLNSDVKGYFKTVIEFINALNKPVFAVDIPSGLNADTGQVCGVCIRAQTTATFAFAKIGHVLYPGATYTGDLEVIDIGIPNFIAEQINPRQHLITAAQIAAALPCRPPDAHKGHNGHLLVVAGSIGKTGAAAMTAMSAMRSGAGLVTLGIPAGLNSILEAQVIEAMTMPLPETAPGMLGESSFDAIMELSADKRCLALGPGIGTAPDTVRLVQRIVQESPVAMVIDADGLNCLAGNIDILTRAKAPVILTPHPGEMERLTGTTAKTIQMDRIGHARGFAQRFGVHLVLKGARTVVAHPDGQVFVNPTGNPGMASGGTGDVLTGIIAGLIVQGCEAGVAARAGVYLHGAAADKLAETCGGYGYLATEIMDVIPNTMAHILTES